MADSCPISTEGLQALLDLVNGIRPQSAALVRNALTDRALVEQRLQVAFGHEVDSWDVKFALEEIA